MGEVVPGSSQKTYTPPEGFAEGCFTATIAQGLNSSPSASLKDTLNVQVNPNDPMNQDAGLNSLQATRISLGDRSTINSCRVQRSSSNSHICQTKNLISCSFCNSSKSNAITNYTLQSHKTVGSSDRANPLNIRNPPVAHIRPHGSADNEKLFVDPIVSHHIRGTTSSHTSSCPYSPPVNLQATKSCATNTQYFISSLERKGRVTENEKCSKTSESSV